MERNIDLNLNLRVNMSDCLGGFVFESTIKHIRHVYSSIQIQRHSNSQTCLLVDSNTKPLKQSDMFNRRFKYKTLQTVRHVYSQEQMERNIDLNLNLRVNMSDCLGGFVFESTIKHI
jgi:hypothetical protein